MEFDDIVEFDYENPSTYWVRGLMNEGLIRTYNPYKTFNYVNKALNGRVKLESCEDYKMIIITEPQLVKQLNQCMNCCGYYQNHTPVSSVRFKLVKCFYAAKYTNNQSLENTSIIGHFAPKYLEAKIMKDGFVPKAKNNYFNYPGRVHFFNADNINNAALNYIGDVLCSANMNKMNNGDYVLFLLDCRKIHNDVQFHTDQDWIGTSVYTYDNIPYDAVISKQYYHFNNPGTGLENAEREK